MAAHSVTILRELVGKMSITDAVREQFLFGLDYAHGLDIPYLKEDQWRDLKSVLETGTEDDVISVATEILADRVKEWERLGRPSNCFEWHKRLDEEVEDE